MRSDSLAADLLAAKAADPVVAVVSQAVTEPLAWLVEATGDVVRVLALTERAFTVVEVDAGGQFSVNTVPVERIRQIEGRFVGGVLTVAVEVDAGRTVTRNADGGVETLPVVYVSQPGSDGPEPVEAFLWAALDAL